MANDRTKAALAQLVGPETLDDIEEFLRPEFPPKKRAMAPSNGALTGPRIGMRRRIVMDGHGRWREVREEGASTMETHLRLVDSRNLSELKGLLGINSVPPNFRPSSKADFTKTFPVANSRYKSYHGNSSMSRTLPSRAESRTGAGLRPSESQPYDHLGMTTRSNVFPGVGNCQWNSTTAKTFTKKPFIPVEERDKFFGILTDDFGQWSAANVHHERMKKAWEDYLAAAPKPTGAAPRPSK